MMRILIMCVLVLVLQCGVCAASVLPTARVGTLQQARALAMQIYAQTGGEVARAHQKGIAQARSAASGVVQSWTMDVSPGIKLTPAADVEHDVSMAIWMDLGARIRRDQAMWDRVGDAAAMRADVERWRFVSTAQQLFAQWRADAQLDEALTQEVASLNERLTRWATAPPAWLSDLERESMEAECARIAIDAQSAAIEAESSANAFEAHIGRDVALYLGHSKSEKPASSIKANPWAALLSDVDNMPELRALRAEASAARARARAAGTRRISVGVGATSQFTAHGGVLLMPEVSVEVPLQLQDAEDAALAQSKAEALRLREARKMRLVHTWLAQQSAYYEQLVKVLDRIDAHGLHTLHKHLDVLEAAAKSDRVDAWRVIQAQRDLIAARDRSFELHARLASNVSAATTLRDFLRAQARQ